MAVKERATTGRRKGLGLDLALDLWRCLTTRGQGHWKDHLRRRYNGIVLVHKSVLEGRTVHIVPGERGTWHVSDLQGNVFDYPSKTAAIEHAKRIAMAGQPAQVVLVNQFGHLEPVARFQLPDYPRPEHGVGGSVFEAAIKSLIIGGFIAAGAAVLGDLIDSVDQELQETGTSKGSRRRNRRNPG